MNFFSEQRCLIVVHWWSALLMALPICLKGTGEIFWKRPFRGGSQPGPIDDAGGSDTKTRALNTIYKGIRTCRRGPFPQTGRPEDQLAGLCSAASIRRE